MKTESFFQSNRAVTATANPDRIFASSSDEPTVVAAYLEHLADEGYKTSTISRRSSAISVVHQAAGEESPTRDARVRASMKGIRRALGSAVEQKTPFSSEDLRAAFGSMGDALRDDRDRALLAVGFAGGFRRSELVALEVADLEEVPEGYRVTVRRSKADQDGRGMTKAIVYGRHDQTGTRLPASRIGSRRRLDSDRPPPRRSGCT